MIKPPDGDSSIGQPIDEGLLLLKTLGASKNMERDCIPHRLPAEEPYYKNNAAVTAAIPFLGWIFALSLKIVTQAL